MQARRGKLKCDACKEGKVEKKMKKSGRHVGKKGWKRWLMPGICVFASGSLYLLLMVLPGGEGPLSADGRISREGYGGGNQKYQLLVEGLESDPVPVTVTVSARVHTEKEAQQAFLRIMDTMEERIRGENPSLMEVRSNLALPTRISPDGVHLRWYVSEPEFMDSTGKVCREVEQETYLTLSVQLSVLVTGKDTVEEEISQSSRRYQENYEIPIRLLPPKRTEQEQRLAALENRIHELDLIQQAQEWIKLPEVFDGKHLTYYSQEKEGYEAILILGILAAVLLAAREQGTEREYQKKREKELLLDYAEILSKLIVLIGAGLTSRNAWERIVQDYETVKRRNEKKSRAAYEEMAQTCYQMRNGISEGEAYRDFGRRCRLQPYLKLSSLLEQNRRSGTKNLRNILQTEMADALEQRKNLALRLGEEAGTRLLMPLFLMLGIIMVMIMVPAMMAMG